MHYIVRVFFCLLLSVELAIGQPNLVNVNFENLLNGFNAASSPSTPHEAYDCSNLPTWDSLSQALKNVQKMTNGGFGFNMWATMVNRDGQVCSVAMSGSQRGDQWPGSRVISAQKANTANAFCLPGFSLSTANLYSAVQPGGSLFGLQFSNPVDTSVAYAGPSTNYGTSSDPMVGKKIGGVNVFGGGLGLYHPTKGLIGGIGLSGDSSCADHIIAWRIRNILGLDYVPAGVAGSGSSDNMILDLDANGKSPSGWGHPLCAAAVTNIVSNLPAPRHP